MLHSSESFSAHDIKCAHMTDNKQDAKTQEVRGERALSLLALPIGGRKCVQIQGRNLVFVRRTKTHVFCLDAVCYHMVRAPGYHISCFLQTVQAL